MELDGTAAAARFVALAMSPTNRLYWSDARSIRSTQLASDGMRTTTDTRTEIGSLVRVAWHGVNFGSNQADIMELSVLATRCLSVTHWQSTRVECLVPLTVVDASPGEDDCVIRTTRGSMRGVARNRYAEMRASGLQSPIVERLEIAVVPLAPHAMAIDGDAWLYWANAADGSIYRSSLTDTPAIRTVARNEWGVKGLVLVRSVRTDALEPAVLELVYSVEGKAQLMHTRVDGDEDATGSSVLVSGLHSPRGLAVDPAQTYLYFTEKTGRIYRVPLHLPTVSSPLTTGAAPELLVTVSALTRLDGLAVDDSNVYWCESNSNVVARASVVTLERHVVIGGTADSALSWPRSIVVRSTDGVSNEVNDDFVFTEYTGRISKGKTVVVNELAASNMKRIDLALQQRDSSTVHFFALE